MTAPSQAAGKVTSSPSPSPDENILTISGVAKSFGGVRALDGVDLTVGRGSLSGLIGPNGAGKSSLFNVITGVLAPDEGHVRLGEVDVTGRSLDEMARAGVARTFQSPRGFTSMTVLENLLVAPASREETLLGALIGRRAGRRAALDRAGTVLERLGLERLRDVPYGELSGGELRLLEIGRHLMRDIDVLLLDEPTAGVIPSMQERITHVARDLAASGITVLVVEHNLRFVFELVSSVAVMVSGCIISRGTPAEIQQDPEVIAAYLGGGDTHED